MLAEVAARLGRYDDAENLLARCLELAPGFTAARHNYAVVLHRQDKPAEALREIERLLAARAAQPELPQPEGRGAGARSASTTRAIEHLSTACSPEYPSQPKVWMSYGHALKTAGRQAEGVAAYRRGIELAPRPGRGLVEPGQPQDLPLHAARPRGDARAARRART